MIQQHPEDMLAVVRMATEVANCAIRIEDELSCLGTKHEESFSEERLFDYAREALSNAARILDFANSWNYTNDEYHVRNRTEAERNNMPFPCERCNVADVATRFCEACAPLADQKLPTGTKVQVTKTVLLAWTANPHEPLSIPAGTEGVVIEDLNEVVAKENATAHPFARRDDRPRYLALVRFEKFNKQLWLRYPDLEVIKEEAVP